MTISYLWTHGENDDFKKTVQNYSNDPVLMKLKHIISRDYVQVEGERSTKISYEDSAWPYRQAQLNGELRKLELVLQLLNFVKDKN